MPTKKMNKKEDVDVLESILDEEDGEQPQEVEEEVESAEPVKDDPATIEDEDVPEESPQEEVEEAEEDAAPSLNDIEKEAYDMASDVPVQVVVVMGKKTVTVKELAELNIGQVVELARPVNEMVDIVAGGKLIAKGELVDVDGKMGVRVIKMMR